MIFLLLVAFVGYAHIFPMINLIHRGDGKITSVPLIVAGNVVCGFIFLWAMTAMFTGEDSYNWMPWLFLIFGIASIAVLASQLFARLKAIPRGKWFDLKSGLTLWALLASLAVTLISLDHLWFIRDTSKIGMMAGGILPKSAGPDCLSQTDLVRLNDDGTLTYRCTHDLMLNATSQIPFIPWPSYTEGTSREARQNLDNIMKEIK